MHQMEALADVVVVDGAEQGAKDAGVAAPDRPVGDRQRPERLAGLRQRRRLTEDRPRGRMDAPGDGGCRRVRDDPRRVEGARVPGAEDADGTSCTSGGVVRVLRCILGQTRLRATSGADRGRIIDSSNEPTNASAGHALTRAPIRPWPTPCARFAPTVATMPAPRLQAARRGTGWFRRLASSTTMDAAQISPSTVNGRSRAVTGLTVRADQFVGVLIGDDRGDDRDGHHRECRRDPDEPVHHRPNSSRQPITNGSSTPSPAASRSASTMAVMA